MKKAQFYVVATPIGNLDDISSHAIKVLKEVDYIACEDTRVTKKLLDKYGISTKTFAYHKFNEKVETEKILSLLNAGKTIALVSDAGTPCICDPGKIVLKTLYENNIKIESVTGACAISTFLSLVPRENEKYVFAGFLERTLPKQKVIFEKYKDCDLVFYESPNRLVKTLENIMQIRGINTKIAVGRELTKIHEEIFVDNTKKVIEHYTKNPPKGEIVVMIYGNFTTKPDTDEILAKGIKLLSQGFSTKDTAKILSILFNVNKNEIYKKLNC